MRNTLVCIVIAVNVAAVNLIAILANVFDLVGMGWIAAGWLVVVSGTFAAMTSSCRSARCRIMCSIGVFIGIIVNGKKEL